ncbi:hypothetical protein MC885_000183 [Smutsia gigantea]|nr:hypothetical protein MC885_000183 [Smutsia gigantea]
MVKYGHALFNFARRPGGAGSPAQIAGRAEAAPPRPPPPRGDAAAAGRGTALNPGPAAGALRSARAPGPPRRSPGKVSPAGLPRKAAILVPGKKGEGAAFFSGSAPRPPRPLLNEGLGVPSPPRAGCLLPSHYSDLLSGTWPPKASWGCGFQARLGALWTLPIRGEEELHRGCLLPSASRQTSSACSPARLSPMSPPVSPGPQAVNRHAGAKAL